MAVTDPRAAELVRTLGLKPHPEGGHFAEVFRSSRAVPVRAGATRPAATHILYLLGGDERSRWHRLASDEIWHWYEGGPLQLLTVDRVGRRLVRRTLGPAGPGALPALEVPAGAWQAARPLGAFCLVGCTVAPGFEYADFDLLADNPLELGALREAGVEPGDLL